MPLTEKVTIKREITYSKDRKHKFLLSIEWDNKLPKALVIMISPSDISNKISNDLSTQLVINNLFTLGYGGVAIGNLTSDIGKRSMRISDKAAPYHKENFDTIVKASNQANVKAVILAWGSIGNTNQAAKKLQDELIKLLDDKKDIMYYIDDGRGKKGLHPLTPSIRSRWILVPYKEAESIGSTSDNAEVEEDSQINVDDEVVDSSNQDNSSEESAD